MQILPIPLSSFKLQKIKCCSFFDALDFFLEVHKADLRIGLLYVSYNARNGQTKEAIYEKTYFTFNRTYFYHAHTIMLS